MLKTRKKNISQWCETTKKLSIKPFCSVLKVTPSIEPVVLPDIQVRRRVTADEVDIKDLEAAVRGEGVESPRQEIARLRRQVEPEHYDLDLNKEVRSHIAALHIAQ